MGASIHFLKGVFGGKENPNNSKKEKNQEKTKIIPIKKGGVAKKIDSTSISPERKRALEDLKSNFRRAYSASFELKTITKNGGTDLEKLQMKAIHSQLGVIAKMLDNFKR